MPTPWATGIRRILQQREASLEIGEEPGTEPGLLLIQVRGLSIDIRLRLGKDEKSSTHERVLRTVTLERGAALFPPPVSDGDGVSRIEALDQQRIDLLDESVSAEVIENELRYVLCFRARKLPGDLLAGFGAEFFGERNIA